MSDQHDAPVTAEAAAASTTTDPSASTTIDQHTTADAAAPEQPQSQEAPLEQSPASVAAAVASASPTPSLPLSLSASPSPAPRHAASHLLSTRAAQITPACHVTKPDPEAGTDGNVFVHVIDGTGKFSCSPVDLTYLVLHAQKQRDSDYSVVGIMGCQSTGKSTLLNLLFGTQFQMMDSSQGRSQTTKGVWMDSGAKKRDIVVMDLEGTDSGERGEDRTTFERQTSLYALAVAEVLLINMWEHDIGRYTASNYGILKTVFEVNLQLFDAHNRTVLMFVIRDHIEEETPMAQLQSKLRKEVDKIWAEIRKPEKFRDTAVADLFELKFCALPHMKLQKAEFGARVDTLRSQFTDPSNADYLFRGDFHGRKSVPADGFGVYMEQCWTTIRDNKELNLPTQKEMLATFRCDEIIHTLYADTFTPQLAPLKEQATRELVAEQFAAACEPLIRTILADYTDETKHYHAGIVAAKKRELLRKMARELEEIFATQARKFVAKQTLDVFRTELKAQLAATGAEVIVASSSSGGKRGSVSSSSHDAPHPAFAAATGKATAKAMAFATEQLAKFQLPVLSSADAAAPGGAAGEAAVSDVAAGPDPMVSWTALSQKVQEELTAAVDSAIAVERAQQLKKLSFHLDKVFKAQLSAPLTAILKRANPRTMWVEVGKLYRKVRAAVVQSYVLDTLAASYACSPDEAASLADQSETQLAQLCRLIVDQHVGMISLHLRSKFDALFRYDGEGRIRKWAAADNIRAVFKSARDETLLLLDLFAVFRLDEYADADSEANQAHAREEEEARARASRTKSKSRANLMDESKSRDASPEPASSSSTATSSGASSDDEDGRDAADDEKIGHTNIDYSKVDAANMSVRKKHFTCIIRNAILDAAARLEKESTFRFDIEGALREAELQQQQNEEKTRVPLWMVGLVLFLGMDEVMAVLRNPFLLVFLLLVGGAAYMAHQVGALWPMISVAKATALQFIAQAQASLAPPAQAVAGGGTEPALTRRPSTLRNPSLARSYTSSSPKQSRSGSRRSSVEGPTVEMQEMLSSSSPAVQVADVEVELAESAGRSSRRGSGIKKRASVIAKQDE